MAIGLLESELGATIIGTLGYGEKMRVRYVIVIISGFCRDTLGFIS